VTPADLIAVRARAAGLVARMTLAEKAAQMAQVDKNSITPAEVADLAIGSVLSGGGGNPDPNTPAEWAAMVGSFLDAARRSRLGIPLLYGSDGVHGHSNVAGATIFPHNIGLGAAADPGLVESVYRATAVEMAATGVRWDFAPTVAVAQDPRWGRTYESFGDDPEHVAGMGAAAVRGLVGPLPGAADSVLACAKHFVGDGATEWDTTRRVEWNDWWDGWGTDWHIDQGDARVDETVLRSVHLPPYVAAVGAGALSVMASYSSWNGEKLHAHRMLITDVLKGELGFEGFVVSDWLGIDQLDPDPYRCVVASIGAGLDMVMVPFEYRRFIADVVRAVESGDLPMERVDDAVLRILTVKHLMGLFDEPPPPPPIERVGCAAHRDLARRAAAASVVLLDHGRRCLPITEGPVAVAGAGADDIGLQCGGWTVEWLGAAGPITRGTTILEGLRSAAPAVEFRFEPGGEFEGGPFPVGLVVVAEPPYAEGAGDRGDLTLPRADVDLIERVRSHVDRLVLVVLSGRPLILDAVLDRCDAVVAAWLPGTEGDGVAEVLAGKRPFRGRLPRPWPAGERSAGGWQRGHGMAL